MEHLSGREFERAYVDDMVQRHHEALQLTLRITTDACLPSLRTLARHLVPVLEEHDDLAKGMQPSRRREAA